VEEQWPIVGRGDVYYGGTTYENSQGLGVQLESAVQRGESVKPLELDISKIEKNEGLLAVPVTRLYDLGQTVRLSQTLKPRLAKPYVVMHPLDAGDLDIEPGTEVYVNLNGFSCTVLAHLDETMPPGFVLVPRSVGIPIGGPVAVEVRRAERIMA